MAPRITHVRKAGWYSRWVRFGWLRAHEVYCPDCFAVAGWPELKDGWALVPKGGE